MFIASDPEWAEKFRAAGLPIIGDDIKSQVGATITHRVMAKLFEDRGVELLRTYQLNFGGNMDFMNMLERKRLQSKKISKTQSVTSQIPHEMQKADVHIGPSDYVPWLDDRKWAYVRLEGRAFGDVPLNLEYKLEVWDSPNSAGVIIDAVRAAKIALDRGLAGPVLSASSYFMKSPPEQYSDSDAYDAVEKFIAGELEGQVEQLTQATGPAGRHRRLALGIGARNGATPRALPTATTCCSAAGTRTRSGRAGCGTARRAAVAGRPDRPGRAGRGRHRTSSDWTCWCTAPALATIAPLADTPVDVWRQTMELNVIAVAELTRLLLPALRARPRAGSCWSTRGRASAARPHWGAYAASKFALRAYADVLRAEEAEHGLRVTSVFPGRTDTDMQRGGPGRRGRRVRAGPVSATRSRWRRRSGSRSTPRPTPRSRNWWSARPRDAGEHPRADGWSPCFASRGCFGCAGWSC